MIRIHYFYQMNKVLLASTILMVGALLFASYELPSSQETSHQQYRAYLAKFSKAEPNGVQFLYRAQIFESFLAKIEKHNADSTQSWKMGINQFSDLTQEEFINFYLGEKNSAIPMLEDEPVNAGFAGEIDWRTKGIITAVKNQGKCGSCWAFAATAAHETYQVKTHGRPNTISLSEQQLVDCATGSPYDNQGCNGGFGARALEYIKDFGQTVTAQYPYVAVNQPCQVPTGVYRIFGVAEIAGCEEIEATIQRTPMAVRVDASNWHTYASGIFDNCATGLNHAVFLVGSSETAWTIKNSWSNSWGEDGFIRLKKGNTCGVCFGPSFPI